MTAPKRSGDARRPVERAIESHADTPGEIASAVEPPRKRIVRSAIWLAVTGISLYLVFPSLVEVFGSWRQITRFSIRWLARMAGLQRASFAWLWALQYVALRGPRWRAGDHLAAGRQRAVKVAPGGGAVGAALQYRILVRAGAPRRRHRDRADRGQRAGVRDGARRCRCWRSPRCSAAA